MVGKARCTEAVGQVRRAEALVAAAIAAADPAELAPTGARRMAQALGSLQKLVASAAVRYSSRAGRDAAHVLAGAQGTTLSKAKAGIALAAQLASVPPVREAFAKGELSIDQAALIAPAALAAPKEAGSLVETAKSSSVRELKKEAERTIQRARGEEAQRATERRLHEQRFCRFSFPSGGGVRLEAFFSTVDGAKVKAAIENQAGRLFKQGWSNGSHAMSADHLRADALAGLLTGEAGGRGSGNVELLVRVDARALVGGEVLDGEVCEIAGVGPVSVAAARELLGEGFLTLLVTDGADIKTVTSTTRDIPRRVEKAILLRDECCVVPSCGSTYGLQTDHWRLDFSWRGPTELDNLCLLCALHHRMKTRTGWKILGGPGKWKWLPPPRARPSLAS